MSAGTCASKPRTMRAAAIARASGSLAKARAIAAEHVARKLIEQDEQRQRAFGGLLPSGEFAGGGGFVGREKAPADFLVEARRPS